MNNNNIAYDIVAKITNPASFAYMPDFPGSDKLGLDPVVPTQKLICDAVIYALQAGTFWSEFGDNSAAFGKLEAMLEYGIVTTDQINQAIHTYINSKTNIARQK